MFLSCRNSDMSVQSCIKDTIFSITKGFCDLRERVQFTDHVAYIVSELNHKYSQIFTSCPPGIEGLHLYPYDCTKYINCSSSVDGRLLVLACPSNNVFSISRRKCLAKHQVSMLDRVKYVDELTQNISMSQILTESNEASTQAANDNKRIILACPGSTEGSFPYPFDNTIYLVCRREQILIEKCASGEVFSLSKRQCRPRDSLKPSDMALFLQESSELDIGHHYTTGSLYFACPSKIDHGMFLHPFDCTKYIRCRGGYARFENCPPGTVFSISRGRCVERDQVEAYDRVEYVIDTQHEFSSNSSAENRDFNDPLVCPIGYNGKHAHPHDCTKYFDCVNGETHVESCGPGTAWNTAMEVCDIKDKVDCTGRESNRRHNIISSYDGSLTVSHKKIQCPAAIRDGYYAHPFDSTKYFYCKSGQSILGRCSQGTLFSISKRSCVPTNQIDGSDHVLFITETSTDAMESYGCITCPGANGLYIFPFDASKYVRCENGRTTIESCGGGTVFDNQQKICMPIGQVDKIDRVVLTMEHQNEWQQSNHKDSSFDGPAIHLESVICPVGASGMHPHPYDCTKFLNCANGETNVQSCGPGTAWSSDMEVCDFIDKVNCHGRGQDAWKSEQKISSEKQITSLVDKIECTVDIGDGFYPHPFDDTKYFICQYGLSFVGQCREGTVFSISRRVCDSSSRVLATDRVTFSAEFLSKLDSSAMFQSSESPVICPHGAVGVTVYPFNCKKFLNCQHGSTYIETCPPDTVFSLANRKCLPIQLVESMDRVAFVQETQNDLYYRKNNDAKMSVFCPMGFTGTFQHPYDWTKYLDCTNGESVVKVCPLGTVFSVSRGTCDMEINVPYTDRCHTDQRHDALMYEGGLYEKPITDTSTVIKLNNPECPSGASGLYPHPYDCSKFLNCANGKASVQNCGSGTAWNTQTNACDFKHNVGCSDTPTAHISAPVVKGIDVQCPAGAAGMRAHPFDCTKFLICADGATSVQACGPGTAWSIDMEVCDFISNVDCNNRENIQYHNIRNSKSYDRTTATTQTDRWTNMNMARPDGNSYGHQRPIVDSSQWTAQREVNSDHSGVYGQQDGYNHHNIPPVSKHTDSNWSGVGSAVGRQTPGKNELVMEGSYEPNRNYVTSVHTYSAPLAPFHSDNASNFSSTMTTTTQGTKNTVYGQAVTSQDSSIDEPHRHMAGHDRPSYPLPSYSRQNFSRNINYNSNSNSRTPIVRHESTLESHTVQLPNQQLVPPHDQPSIGSLITQSIDVPKRQFLPPPIYSDGGQEPIEFDENISDGGQFEISTNDEQTQSASEYRPVVSLSSFQEPSITGDLLPPIATDPSSNQQQHTYDSYGQSIQTPTIATKLTVVTPDEDLRPPSAYTSDDQILPSAHSKSTNVHVFQIYPAINNVTSVNSHGNPHYSSPYSGVAHSRNTTWKNTYIDSDDSESLNSPPTNLEGTLTTKTKTTTTTTTTGRKVLPMPPADHHKYYSNTPSLLQPQYPQMATDFVDTDMPVNDALQMLLRPYFNRSGTVSDDVARQAESHIMNLIADSEQSTPTPSRSISDANFRSVVIAGSDKSNQRKQIGKDFELILAGEQSSLATVATKNITHKTGSDRKKSYNPHTWQKSFSQSNEYSHHYNPHTPHHTRDFHVRHPEMPDPFASDKSIEQTDSLDAPNPYAEPTTPRSNVHPSIQLSIQNGKCDFDCGNGKCVKSFEICDGVNNCGNRKDESKCNHLGYEIRLAGAESRHMGRLEVKILGEWGYVCDDKFGLRDADVVCRELGFHLGASEIRGSSYYPALMPNPSFAMDGVECNGNETSIKDCDFKGWGVHNCGADQVVGVVCKVPLFKCPNNYWLCSTSKECIPPAFLCDNTPDCADLSDESDRVCKAPIEFRLEGGHNRNEGRLEIKYRGEWGTVCDDDFGTKEAQVVCNSLGYYGKPVIEKNIYGPGSGPIWLDQVSCLGNETSIDKCNHWTWGEHNCNHTEDVEVHCTIGPPPRHLLQQSASKPEQPESDEDVQEEYPFDQSSLERSSKFLRSQQQQNCGQFKSNMFDEYAHPEERVINGTIAKRGRHPWQATIRTRGRGGISSHWCGAVLISDGSTKFSSHLLTAAHCLAGYQKGAYFVRMGDHYSKIAESSEIDSFIENWYIHEKFRDGTHMNNDIAVILLKNPVRFNDYIQPVCLPEQGDRVQNQRECTISGWGSIKSGLSTPSNILRAARVPILPDDTCKQPHVYGASLTEGMFCAGSMDESVDACDGDSGGPLVCSDNGAETLHGIISWGQHCGYANKPGVYVRIEKYVDWIYEKINFSLKQNKKAH